jgi:hypothetical protein
MNPILWQERTYKERRAPRWSRGGMIVGVAFVITLIVCAYALLINAPGYNTTRMALFTVWIVHFAAGVRALMVGANVISREHVGQTWDALVLTGVSARRILLGKWLAALYAVRGWMLVLGAVHVAMLPIFSLGLLKTFAERTMRYGSSSYYYEMERMEFTLLPWAVVLAVVAAVALTVLEMMCCTALGMAASALTKRNLSAAVLALCVRFAPVAIFALYVRYELGPRQFWQWWGRTEFSLSDVGTSATMVLALPVIPWTQGDHIRSVPGLIAAVLLLVTMTSIALTLTMFVVRRTGALPHAQLVVKSGKVSGFGQALSQGTN